MAVNNEFCFTIKGATIDAFECIQGLVTKMSSFGITINGQYHTLLNKDLNEIRDIFDFSATDAYYAVSCGGPYGRFELLDYCSSVIKEILTQTPNIILNGEVHSDSCVDGSQRILAFEYKDRHLTILDSEYFSPFDDGYAEYVQSILPFKKFAKLFSVDPDEFDEDEYYDFIMDCIYSGELSEWTYDDFCDEFDSELTERQFNNRMKKFAELNILTYEDYVVEKDIETTPDKKYWRKLEFDI